MAMLERLAASVTPRGKAHQLLITVAAFGAAAAKVGAGMSRIHGFRQSRRALIAAP